MSTTGKDSLAAGEGLVPASPHRVIAFARFFKNYMGVSSIVAAALPIPVTSFDLIAVPTGMNKTLSVYTSLFCFLTLGMIFFSRHALARYMFPRGELKPTPRAFLINLLIHPLVYMVACFACVFIYHSRVGWGMAGDIVRVSQEQNTIHALFYIGIFVFAETSFILMAIKEYLQDLLKLSDIDLILGSRAEKS